MERTVEGRWRHRSIELAPAGGDPVTIPLSGKVWSIARTGLALLACLAPSTGRAQGPVLGEGAAQIDAPVPGRSVTPGQDSFLYPSPVVPGVGGSIVPKPLGSLAPIAPLRPLRRTPSPESSPAGTSYPESAGGSSAPLTARRMWQPWVNRPGRGFSYAIVRSPKGVTYHWICWASLREYYYLFDSAAVRYLGVYDRVTGVYRPLDGATRRWGKAIAPPVPVPSEPSAAPGSPSRAAPIQQQPGHPGVSGDPRAKAEFRAPAAMAESARLRPS
jgi:hypothetical protein